MTLVLRGHKGVLDVLREERTKIQTELDKTDKSRRNSHRWGALSAEVGLLKYLIGILGNAVMLTEEGYDELSGRFSPPEEVKKEVTTP